MILRYKHTKWMEVWIWIWEKVCWFYLRICGLARPGEIKWRQKLTDNPLAKWRCVRGNRWSSWRGYTFTRPPRCCCCYHYYYYFVKATLMKFLPQIYLVASVSCLLSCQLSAYEIFRIRNRGISWITAQRSNVETKSKSKYTKKREKEKKTWRATSEEDEIAILIRQKCQISARLAPNRPSNCSLSLSLACCWCCSTSQQLDWTGHMRLCVSSNRLCRPGKATWGIQSIAMRLSPIREFVVAPL